jgi:spore coat protein U-like protein
MCLLAQGTPSWSSTLAPRSNLSRSHGGCRTTVTSFSFGSFSPLSHAGRSTQGYVTFSCPSAVADIELSAGDAGQFVVRRKAADHAAPSTLAYNIYLDAGHTVVFGDGSGGSSAYVPSPNVLTGSFPIYGEITGVQQDLPVARYSDSITITVNMVP